MKIACLQFAPELGQVEKNIQRANELLQNANLPARLDWLVLPELAFSGTCYNIYSESCTALLLLFQFV